MRKQQKEIHLNKRLLERLFVSASIRRWNDKAVPLDFVEIDKQAHKIILAYFFAKYEEDRGNNIDYTILIQQFIFEFFERVVLTDIKPPVFDKLKKTHGKQLSDFVITQLSEELSGFCFFDSMKNYLANSNNNIETRILKAAHFYASKWEFDIIYNFNPKLYDIENIKNIIDSQSEGFYDLIGVQNLKLYQDARELIGMFAELRFQKRWSQTPRIPQTSVLGHMLMVAICAYLISIDLDICEEMQINHFFGGLFHDLPEVLTRDIISPIKRSVEGLDTFIKQIEKEEMQDKILSKLPKYIKDDITYWTEDEFCNRYKDNGQIILIEDSNMLLQFNENKYCPICGELLKFCDKLTAFLEAKISISHGVSSPDLINGASSIYKEIENKEVFSINIGMIAKAFG